MLPSHGKQKNEQTFGGHDAQKKNWRYWVHATLGVFFFTFIKFSTSLANSTWKKLIKDVSVSKKPQFNLEYYPENLTKFVQRDTNYTPE